MQQAVREWAWVVGAEVPDRQWLLSDYDSWERNPHYRGPDQGHPEEKIKADNKTTTIRMSERAMILDGFTPDLLKRY